jgi:hypothetical protein
MQEKEGRYTVNLTGTQIQEVMVIMLFKLLSSVKKIQSPR